MAHPALGKRADSGARAGQSRPGLPPRVDGKAPLPNPSKPEAGKLVSPEARKARAPGPKSHAAVVAAWVGLEGMISGVDLAC